MIETIQPKTGNPLWPLPPDYLRLGPTDQRIARLAACKMTETPEHCVHSWNFFCRYYLDPEFNPDGTVVFDPMFYKPPVLPPAPLHYNLVRWWCQYPYSAVAAPRGSAKSTCKRSFLLWRLLNFPTYEINSFLAKDDFVIEEFDRIKTQLQTNERILADFGDMRESRGGGVWNNHMIRLRNRALLRGLSMQAFKRGPRSSFTIVDDVEDDVSEKKLRNDTEVEDLRMGILKVLGPMLGDGCHMGVVGTLVDMRSFLYHATTDTEDPAFKLFFRANVPVKSPDGSNAWKEKYTDKFLSDQQALLGVWFGSEYMGMPTSTRARLLRWKPADHTYKWENRNGLEGIDPWNSQATVHWAHTALVDGKSTTVPKSAIWSKWVDSLQRFTIVDYATSESEAADSSVIHTVGLDSENVLWSLDLWEGKLPSPVLCDLIWEKALLWRVGRIGVESYATQQGFGQTVESKGRQIMDTAGWAPAVLFVRPPSKLSKGEKIAAIKWRFDKNAIKFPADRLTERPGYANMVEQIVGFTLDLKGLRHDDCVDTLGMVPYVAPGGRIEAPPPSAPSVVDRILQGEKYIEGTNVPLAALIRLESLTPGQKDDILQLVNRQYADDVANAQADLNSVDGYEYV